MGLWTGSARQGKSFFYVVIGPPGPVLFALSLVGYSNPGGAASPMDGPVPVVAPVAVVDPVRGCGSDRPVGFSYTAKDSSPMDSPPRKAPVAAVDLQWVF